MGALAPFRVWLSGCDGVGKAVLDESKIISKRGVRGLGRILSDLLDLHLAKCEYSSFESEADEAGVSVQC